MSQSTQPEFPSILVIGGEGFLGHNLVLTLLAHYPDSIIWSLDITQRHFDSNPYLPDQKEDQSTQSSPLRHRFIQADLTSVESLLSAFHEAQPQAVFHTASPWSGSSLEVCQKVNVQGTLNTIQACQALNVRRLVYTSSAGVVFNGNHLVNVDERLPIPKIGCDHYNTSKAEAEAIVLQANGKDSLLTCAIRPAGIFGPGDRQAIPGMIQVMKNRQNGIQIGDNKNLFDWTYVDNVVHAHILALEKLEHQVPLTAFETTLKPIFKTIKHRQLLTSASGGAGRTKTEADNDSNVEGAGEESIENLELIDLSDEMNPGQSDPANQVGSSTKEEHDPTSWIKGSEHLIDLPLPAKRHRWDQWAPISTQINYPDQSVPVAGEAFFVTGGEPVFFWDFARAIWHEYGKCSPISKKSNLKPQPDWRFVIPTSLAFVLAFLAQLWSNLSRKPVLFTPEKVRYTCASKHHNIEKARVVLGYEPVVGIEEGIQKSVKWYILNESLDQTAADKKNN